MEYNKNKKNKLTEGVLIDDRVDELNNRILDRAFANNKPMKPLFNPRSVSTKYVLFPVLDNRPEIYLEDKVDVGENIEIETDLYGRNERSSIYDYGSKYRPSLESDMYNDMVGKPMTDTEHTLLFARPRFETFIHPNLSTQVGNDTFNNHTRTQLRGSHK